MTSATSKTENRKPKTGSKENLKSEISKSDILRSDILKPEILRSEILKSEILKSDTCAISPSGSPSSPPLLQEPPITELPASGGPVIRALPAVVANQIAAGEVVERPASVVKELMENSIDAQARRIDLVVTAGGRKLVSVADDGVGMVRDDAIMCLERQATSKIRTSEDIASISTMGFRGEAIPSIASVSRFRIATRPRALDVGTEVEVCGGELVDVRDCGCPAGTLVEVRDLFFNLPARRKFLRTYQTEQSVIRSMFLTLALANPSIAFTFKADGLELYNLPPSDAFPDRLRDLYGADVFDHLRPVDSTVAGIRVHGFVSTPDWTRPDRSEQYLFVNRRPASAPVVYSALREAYPPLAGDRKPVIFLFLDLDPASVDVNVHPTKREVRFRQPAAVREAILLALSRALGGAGEAEAFPVSRSPFPVDPSPEPQTGNRKPAPSTVAPPPPIARPLPFPRAADPLAPTIPLPQRPIQEPPSPPPSTPSPPPQSPAPQPPAPVSAPVPAPDGAPWKWYRLLGPLGGRYALLETDDGLVLLESRAAHMRVLYEELLPPPGTRPESQMLLIPEAVDLPPVDAHRIRTHLPVFRSMGFGIEPIDGDSFLVDSLPSALGDTPARPLLIDIAAAIEEAGPRRGRERWIEEAMARAAARHAAGSGLSASEIDSIVQRLARCRMPYTSPFGKPTIILLSYREIARKFGLS